MDKEELAELIRKRKLQQLYRNNNIPLNNYNRPSLTGNPYDPPRYQLPVKSSLAGLEIPLKEGGFLNSNTNRNDNLSGRYNPYGSVKILDDYGSTINKEDRTGLAPVKQNEKRITGTKYVDYNDFLFGITNRDRNKPTSTSSYRPFIKTEPKKKRFNWEHLGASLGDLLQTGLNYGAGRHVNPKYNKSRLSIQIEKMKKDKEIDRLGSQYRKSPLVQNYLIDGLGLDPHDLTNEDYFRIGEDLRGSGLSSKNDDDSGGGTGGLSFKDKLAYINNQDRRARNVADNYNKDVAKEQSEKREVAKYINNLGEVTTLYNNLVSLTNQWEKQGYGDYGKWSKISDSMVGRVFSDLATGVTGNTDKVNLRRRIESAKEQLVATRRHELFGASLTGTEKASFEAISGDGWYGSAKQLNQFINSVKSGITSLEDRGRSYNARLFDEAFRASNLGIIKRYGSNSDGTGNLSINGKNLNLTGT